ncbi:hypothetical protein sos41_14960 [Alphaproteobacteria bacterium SO-S41]|nr:hypothetical protein sos41_14960 [Alphaproteobacteria bacterium SO-S41]
MAPTVSFTTAQAAVQLTRDGSSWRPTLGQSVTVTYAFRDTAPTSMPDDTAGFSRFNAQQMAAATAALQAWSSVANINFTLVANSNGYSNNGTILFSNYSSGSEGAAGFAYFPSPGGTGAGSRAGDVWINSTLAYNAAPAAGNYGVSVLVHEIGHALGLEHPGDYDAGDDTAPTYGANAEYIEDDRQYTVMSYFSETNTGANFQGKYAYGPMLHDIAAIQRLYGARADAASQNTVYGRPSGNADKIILAIWDTGGIDQLDVQAYTADQRIDLRPGVFSDVGGLKGNVVIAEGVTIEDVLSGSGNDTINGNTADNWLQGNRGNDTLNGREGNDTLVGGDGADVLDGGPGIDLVWYIDAPTGVTAFLLNASANTGFAAGDTYFNIENLKGAGSGDILGGTNGPNAIWGSGGNDYLFGADGDDLLSGGSGRDQLDGQGGFDLASYDDAEAGVTAFLGGAFLNTGDAAGDTYISIEGLAGSRFADLLVGDDGGNIVEGAAGNDYLFGGGGADQLFGGAGDDQLQGGRGADLMDGGDGSDIASFSEAAAGIVMFMLAPQAGTGEAEGDSYNSIESVTGSVFGDILGGTEGANTISGGGGADYIFAAGGDDILDGGAGADRLEGQGGFDFVTYRFAPAGLTVSLAAPEANTGDAQGDTYLEVEGILGSYFNDNLSGDAGGNIVQGFAGNDFIFGAGGNDYVVGDDGDDVLEGGLGADVVDGGAGTDTASYRSAGAAVTVNLATPASNTGEAQGDIYTSIENLLGSQFGDTLTGNAGANVITGGSGADRLTGGGGADSFAFVARSDGGDIITDFVRGLDRMTFLSSAFGNLAVGALDAARLLSGVNPIASTAAATFLFDTVSHQLFFDIDGNGAQASVAIAQFSNNVNLTASDIWIV